MGKYKKHLGLGEPLIIDGEEFVLKPLTTEYLPDFFRVMKAFSGAKPEEMFKNVDSDSLNAIKRIIEVTLKISYPEEDEEEMKQFGLKYMTLIIGKIFEINSPSMDNLTPQQQKFIKDLSKKNEANAI